MDPLTIIGSFLLYTYEREEGHTDVKVTLQLTINRETMDIGGELLPPTYKCAREDKTVARNYSRLKLS